MSAVKSVEAWKWACPDCHDTGLESSIAAALSALDDHRDEYHAPIDPDALDDDEPDDDTVQIYVGPGQWSRTGE